MPFSFEADPLSFQVNSSVHPGNGPKTRQTTIPSMAAFSSLPMEVRLMIWEAALPGPRVAPIRQHELGKTIGEWEDETPGEQWPRVRQFGELDENGEYHLDAGWKDWPNPLGDDAPQRAEDARMCLSVGDGDNDYKGRQLLGIFPDSYIPAMAFVCRESREVFLKHYRLVFSCPGSAAQTYVDFSVDTIYIPQDFSVNFRESGLMDIFMDLGVCCPIEDVENMNKVERLAVWVGCNYSEELLPLDMILPDLLLIWGGVKSLSLVIGDFTDEYESERSDILLSAPFDIPDLIEQYDTFDPYDSYDGVGYVDAPEALVVECEYAQVDMAVLENIRQDHVRCGITWPMPEIRPQVALSSVLLDVLQQVKNEYEENMERHLAEVEFMNTCPRTPSESHSKTRGHVKELVDDVL